MRLLRGFVRLCAVLGGLTLLASYLGAIHPVGDSLAVFRAWIAAGVAVAGLLALMLSVRRAGWMAIVFAAVAGGPIAAMVYAPASEAPNGAVTIYTKNIMGIWGDQDALEADIRASEADVVLLQEYARSRTNYGEALSDILPHEHFCDFGMAVLSSWPISETYCSEYRSFAAARIERPDGAFWAVSTHLVWPYPHPQAQLLQQSLPFLESLNSGRVIVAGDFNMVPWGHSVRQIEEATGTGRIGPLFTTIEVRDVPLQIDHVLTNGDGVVERRPRLGSDHYGLVAQIGWE